MGSKKGREKKEEGLGLGLEEKGRGRRREKEQDKGRARRKREERREREKIERHRQSSAAGMLERELDSRHCSSTLQLFSAETIAPHLARIGMRIEVGGQKLHEHR